MSDILTTSQRIISNRQFRSELLNIEVVDPPTVFPVTLDETKEWLRVDGTDQDTTITALIAAATSWAEGVTRRAFVQRALDVRYANTPPQGRDFVIAFPPIIDPLTAITYEDTDGIAQVIDVADVELEALYGRVRIKPDASITEWPVVQHINFFYSAGYSPATDNADDIPQQIRQAILGAIASMFEVRIDQPVGSQISKPHDFAASMLLNDFRVWGF